MLLSITNYRYRRTGAERERKFESASGGWLVRIGWIRNPNSFSTLLYYCLISLMSVFDVITYASYPLWLSIPIHSVCKRVHVCIGWKFGIEAIHMYKCDVLLLLLLVCAYFFSCVMYSTWICENEYSVFFSICCCFFFESARIWWSF